MFFPYGFTQPYRVSCVLYVCLRLNTEVVVYSFSFFFLLASLDDMFVCIPSTESASKCVCVCASGFVWEGGMCSVVY